MARTAIEIQAEIDEINTALSYIRTAGQSYTITSGSGSGTSRTVTMADYKTLKEERNDLYAELDRVNRGSTRTIRAAW